ncbi:MAG: WD40 repeat protein [Bacillariaceae sp.]|jgi:WD40 repeat protein
MTSIQLNLIKSSSDRQTASTSAETNGSYPKLERLMEGEFSIEAGDVLCLIMGFLTSQGLHESARILRKESGIGFSNGVIQKATVASSIRRGEWGSVIRATFLLGDNSDGSNNKEEVDNNNGSLSAKISEQVILELAEEDKNLNLAYSLLKVHRDALDRIYEETDSSEDQKEAIDATEREEKGKKKRRSKSKSSSSSRLTKARSLEQKLAEIAANPNKFSNTETRQIVLFPQRSKQQRREDLALNVEDQREIPLNRLPTLIQQAMKWQSYTGQLPWIREVNENIAADVDVDNKKKRRKRKRYDLVMGEVAGDQNISVGDGSTEISNEYDGVDEIPQDTMSKVKFGKNAVCESALFFSRGLITGSSDSLIEIWDAGCSYKDLNTKDYPYQKENVMGHTDASVLCMAISNDSEILVSGDSVGKVKIWKLSTGTCLRQYQAHDTSVTALSLSRDASRVLTGCKSGLCREFGIVTQNLLQVYEGHTSYIHACHYALDWKLNGDNNPQTASTEGWVVTSSADGTVRVWNKGLAIRIIQPPSDLKSVTAPQRGKMFSMVVDPTQVLAECPAIHSLLVVPGEESRMLMIPRASTAFLVNLEGTVLQVYNAESSESVFLAASLTVSVVYLASSTGDCLVFSLQTGKLLQTIHNFALDSTSKTNEHRTAEISALIHHPFKPSILAAYSNDKTQKKGVLTVWK